MSKDYQISSEKLHIVFLPYMAPGHMRPMLELAKVFVSLSHNNNIKVTIITTPANATSHTLDTANRFSHITFLTTPLPSKEVGLPEGCENLESTSTSRETSLKLIRAIEMLQPKLETMLADSKPDCIVSDYFFPWTVDVARRLGIPRLAFSGGCFFKSCVSHNLEEFRPHDGIESESQEFVVPNLPDEISLTRSQLQDIVKGKTEFNELFERLKEAEKQSFGVLMNSFCELEHDYADYFRNEMGIKSWKIGPLFLFNKKRIKCGASSNDDLHDDNRHYCLQWLDSKRPKSVVYICFGSLVRFTKAQLTEIASALLDSGCSFIWVVGKVLKSNDEDNQTQNEEEEEEETEEWWVPGWFEEMITMKENNNGGDKLGLVLKGWAPQVSILEHRAIGGFMTHCGWNSILEGVGAGVPLITWPVFADQFYNEQLVTQVLKIGVEVGNKVWKQSVSYVTEVIEKEKIKTAIKRVMGGGKEAEEFRRKVKELSELAHKAVEVGGSSYNDIKALLQEIALHKQSKMLVNE